PVGAVTYFAGRVGRSPDRPYRLFVEPMLIREVSLRCFCARFARTPWDHVFHFTGDTALAQLFLENARNIRLLVLILNLVTAFLAAALARAEHGRLACLPPIGRILTGKALVQNQVGGRCR